MQSEVLVELLFERLLLLEAQVKLEVFSKNLA